MDKQIFPNIEIQEVGINKITRWDIVLSFDNYTQGEYIVGVNTKSQAEFIKQSLERGFKKIKNNLLKITRKLEENKNLIKELK